MAHADDELLSALLDGEAAAGDAAHVEGCDACQNRLAELRSVAMAVASVPHAPAHIREASLAAVIRAADRPLRRVSPLRLRSAAAPDARPRRMNSLSAAAALVVALAVGGLAISQLGSGPGSTNSNTALKAGVAGGTTRAATAPESADAALDDTALHPAAGELANAPATYDAGDLGEVNDVAAVSRRASKDLSATGEGRQGHSGQATSPCPYQPGESPLWQATLTYNGESTVAHLVQLEDTTQIMQILRRADCSVIVSQAFVPTNPR